VLRTGWFDLYRVDRLLQGEVDHEGVKAAVSYLDGLVEAETKEVPASRIVVGGFSQVSSVRSHLLSTLPLIQKHTNRKPLRTLQ